MDKYSSFCSMAVNTEEETLTITFPLAEDCFWFLKYKRATSKQDFSFLSQMIVICRILLKNRVESFNRSYIELSAQSFTFDNSYLVWFYGISTIEGYLIPNLVYTYILDIYDL